ncbi:flagellar biosynthetic protein FliR [Aliidiomarina minuta]|uniref:Flagellar biosynthetic protein FliR n=1 Tax=Aliidiomarina minuta TaxID=880057 RepID=A0A432W534_9GAMM|nr:flagellar biosynthetic protein FliR [Aliidiomarina minuta]RUO24517.1 flagellar biosynthetic protein FliR [Aliidiomarina minuta]
MNILESVVLDWLAQHYWPFVRVSSMFLTMAVFSGQGLPARIKIFFSVAIVFAIAPALPAVEMPFEPVSLSGMLVTVQQILVGVALGFLSLLAVNTFTIAGQVLGMQVGLGFAAMVDPNSGQQVPVLAQFYLLMATLMFLAFDGHLLMLRVVVHSFEAIPVGPMGLDAESFFYIANWATWMFSAALGFALSAMISILLINLSFGVMTRASPQLNIFTIGFPITMISGLMVLWLTVGNFVVHFENQWQRAINGMCFLLGGNC